MTKMEASDNYIYSRNYLKNICTISIIQPQEFYQALKKKPFYWLFVNFISCTPILLISLSFHIVPLLLHPFPPEKTKCKCNKRQEIKVPKVTRRQQWSLSFLTAVREEEQMETGDTCRLGKHKISRKTEGKSMPNLSTSLPWILTDYSDKCLGTET